MRFSQLRIATTKNADTIPRNTPVPATKIASLLACNKIFPGGDHRNVTLVHRSCAPSTSFFA
jgi:hypothetical protein